MNNELGSLLFLYAETPLHAGTGAALGSVDLPIQRERMSGHPVVQGSGIKGALREAFHPPHRDKNEEMSEADKKTEELWLHLFGPRLYDTKNKNEVSRDSDRNAVPREDFAGAISVQDARLLLLPIRSLWGGFAWTTCPLILERLARDAACAGLPPPEWMKSLQELRKDVEKDVENDRVVVGASSMVAGSNVVTLESYDYNANKTNKTFVEALASWLNKHAIPQGKKEYEHVREQLPKRLVVMNDQEFGHWAQVGMEVVTRIAIDRDKGTVKDGALWSEECLPTESLLWAPMYFVDGKKPPKDKTRAPEQPAQALCDLVSTKLDGHRLRLGGDRTVGRGIVMTHVVHRQNGGA